jgi:hypothetical protein
MLTRCHGLILSLFDHNHKLLVEIMSYIYSLGHDLLMWSRYWCYGYYHIIVITINYVRA